MKRRNVLKGMILFSLGSSVIYSCTDPFQAVKDLNLDFVKPEDAQMELIESISKLVVPLQKIPALAQHTALPFILKMVDDIHEPKERDLFIAGYQSFDADVVALTQQPFGELIPEEQLVLLRRLNEGEDGLPKGMQKVYDVIKGESLSYLRNSEHYQRSVNYYEMAPGRFKGDVLLSELKNANTI